MEYKICPNCNNKLDSFLVTRVIVNEKETAFINAFHEPKSVAYCTGCSGALIERYSTELATAKKDILAELKDLIQLIPIVTTNNPPKWEYDILEMVTSQSVTGTGLMSELSSSWSDLLGGQSNSLNSKLSGGENICKDQLRLKTVLAGGNAVIATDIDYGEVGGGKGMLMVCMSGTAIKINNIPAEKKKDFDRIEQLVTKMNGLNSLSYK